MNSLDAPQGMLPVTVHPVLNLWDHLCCPKQKVPAANKTETFAVIVAELWILALYHYLVEFERVVSDLWLKIERVVDIVVEQKLVRRVGLVAHVQRNLKLRVTQRPQVIQN